MSGFFFQAEDGIRDHCVTGVQTCALPIFLYSGNWGVAHDENTFIEAYSRYLLQSKEGLRFWLRSEERRVGKEGEYRSWGAEGSRKRRVEWLFTSIRM